MCAQASLFIKIADHCQIILAGGINRKNIVLVLLWQCCEIFILLIQSDLMKDSDLIMASSNGDNALPCCHQIS